MDALKDTMHNSDFSSGIPCLFKKYDELLILQAISRDSQRAEILEEDFKLPTRRNRHLQFTKRDSLS